MPRDEVTGKEPGADSLAWTAPVADGATGGEVIRPGSTSFVLRRPRSRYVFIRRLAASTWLGAVAGLVYLFLLAPIALVVIMAFNSSRQLQFPPAGLSLQWFRAYWSSGEWIDATWLSVGVAVLTMLVSTVLGTLGAIGLVRMRHGSGRALYGILLSPIIVPQIITAVACYALFVKLRLVGSAVAVAAAHSVLAIPFVIVTVSAALVRVDERLEWAAVSLGMHPLRAFVTVTAPLIAPAIASGAVFAFITSFDEVVVALFLTGTAHPTLPRKMWDAVAMQMDPTLAAVSTIMIAVSVAVLLVGQVLRAALGRYQAVGQKREA
jgi:putative spermidine/putrescine transport system permease protein